MDDSDSVDGVASLDGPLDKAQLLVMMVLSSSSSVGYKLLFLVLGVGV